MSIIWGYSMRTIRIALLLFFVSQGVNTRGLQWIIAGALIEGRHIHQTQVLPNGTLLVMGALLDLLGTFTVELWVGNPQRIVSFLSL